MGPKKRPHLHRLGLAVSWPVRWSWRALGRLGLALRAMFGLVITIIWGPTHWFLTRMRVLIELAAAPLARLAHWIAPFIWEELGRLGVAALRILALLTWPARAPFAFLWRRLFLIWVEPLRQWLSLRLLVIGRAVRSSWMVCAARRRVHRDEQGALAHSRRVSSPVRPWLRLVGAMGALNLILLFLLVRMMTDDRSSMLADAASATLAAAPSPTVLMLPTSLPPPTPVQITPAPPPDPFAVGGTVAFVARHNGNDDILAISAGRDGPLQLTDDPADDRDPAWSPDGRLLAFASRRHGSWDLYVLDVSTGETVRLTGDLAYQAHPSWSPDGQWLAYEGYDEENLDVYIIPVAGGEAIRLTNHPAPDYAPAWSPSGRQIAFVSWRDGNPDLYLFSLDDARDEASINITRSADIAEDCPSWHPGGDYLTFTGRSGGHQIVYVLPFRNNLPSGEAAGLAQGDNAAWAPNGNALLYVHHQVDHHYLLATAMANWGPAPEVYISDQPLRSPTWNRALLPPGIPLAGTTEGDSPLYLEAIADPSAEGAPYTLVALQNLQVPGPYLSDRVDEAFIALRQRVLEETGWDFLGALDAMWEPIDSLPPPGLDAASWNKAGRAFDIARELNLGASPVVEVVPDSGACNPTFIECSGVGTYWRVYVRARRQDGSQGEPLRARPWNFAARYSGNTTDYEAGGAAKPVIPPGYYVDFTQLAADYGWERVPAGPTWRTFFPAALFWHFEKRDGLAWDEAMLELYTAKEVQQGFGGTEP
jgi:TolB protein